MEMNGYKKKEFLCLNYSSWAFFTVELTRAAIKRYPSKIRCLLNIHDDFVDYNEEQIETVTRQLFENTDNILESPAACLENLKLFVNAEDIQQKTLLHLAVECRLTLAINFLISNHFDLHERDLSGNTMLHFLIKEELNTFLNECHVSETLDISNLNSESVDFIKWMILKGLDVDCQNDSGDTVLHVAAKCNLLHTLPILLEHTRDVTIVNDDNMTAFQIFAVSLEKFFEINDRFLYFFNTPVLPIYEDIPTYVCEIYEKFLDKGFSVDVLDESGCTPVHHALKQARYRKLDNILKLMLNHFTKVNAEDKSGMTPLHLAVRYATREIVIRLLELGANVNSKESSQEYTPLHVAVEYNREDLLEVLIDHGADVEARTKKGQTPLHLIKTTKKNVIKKLLEVASHIDINSRDSFGGYTPLHEAVAYGREDLVKLLINNGADVHARTNAGETLLHLIITSKMSEIEKLLELSAGIDVNSRDFMSGYTPLHMAVMYNHEDLVDLLINKGADVNVRTNKGQTALHLVRNSNKCILRQLLNSGAHIDITDNNGYQPLHKAILRKEVYTIETLLIFGADINDTTRLLNINDYLPVSEFISEHLIKLLAAKLFIDKELIRVLKYTSNPQYVYEGCYEEIERMKNFMISCSTSVYDFLRMNHDAKCAYVKKNENANKLNGNLSRLKQQFPIYYVLISSAYCMAVYRKEVIMSAKQAWYEVTGIGIPDLCLIEIFSYLSNANMKVFIEALRSKNQ